MGKRRPSGDGMVRKREDGHWEGRIVVARFRRNCLIDLFHTENLLLLLDWNVISELCSSLTFYLYYTTKIILWQIMVIIEGF